ncbi:hypothetical protein D3C79_844820 [compost metagenome]
MPGLIEVRRVQAGAELLAKRVRATHKIDRFADAALAIIEVKILVLIARITKFVGCEMAGLHIQIFDFLALQQEASRCFGQQPGVAGREHWCFRKHVAVAKFSVRYTYFQCGTST